MTRRFAHMTPSGPKPRILLVDDHRQFLDAVAAMLAEDFDVVGAATDGRHALAVAADVDPEVIVLDVEMPALDGFQTLRALQQAGFATTPAVFLSMHDADEYVNEAFRCGARGYVVKPRISRDLVSALDQALLGRAFVPSLASLHQLANGGMHAMHLGHDPESLMDDVAGFFDVALRRGDATCIIATADIRHGVHERLRALGWDVGGSSGHTRHTAIDTADALNRFMRNGLPDPNQVAEIAEELDDYRRAAAEGTTARLTIFGNMAEMLSAEGNTKAAISLETLWNTFTHDRPFLTLCGYATSCFHDGVPDLWRDACDAHQALSHADDV
ncbi:MAG TPA: response regulator [Vicinamibacterales bacterium]|nr:response regulator [Vicinamibacterales bacterium]